MGSNISTPTCIGIIVGSILSIYVVAYVRGVIHDYRASAADCESGNPENGGQGVIENNGRHSNEEDEKSFDEDARTIVGEENGSSDCEHGIANDISQSLTKDNGQRMTNEDKKRFKEDWRTFTGEEKDMSSVDLTEKGYSEECCGIFNEDRQHSIEEDQNICDEYGRKSLGEEDEKSYTDLNKFYLRAC